MMLRRFTADGLQAFRDFLATCREHPKSFVPRELLEDDTYATVVEPPIEVEQRAFASRAEAAYFLAELLRTLPQHEVAQDVGLWSWLSLFFFDEVCPEQGGQRKVKTDEHYLFDQKNPYRSYRHLLRSGWQILRDAPQYNRLLLRGPVSSIDHVADEVMKRLFLMRIPCIFEVLDRLYWDDERDRPRRGIASSSKPKAGDLRTRLPSRLRQLEKTFDLFSLNADQLIDLLGQEFQRHEAAAVPSNA